MARPHCFIEECRPQLRRASGGWGGLGRGRALADENRPRLYNRHDFNSINLWLSWLIDERKLLVYLAHICDKQSQDQIAMGLTHNYLNATEPQSLTEVT
jgi:hypothetical protein